MSEESVSQVDSAIRLSQFFSSMGPQLVHLDRCPVCEEQTRGKPFGMVRGAAASEAAGMMMPAVRCPHCRFVYLNPRLSDAAVGAFYDQSPGLLAYFTGGFKAEVDGAQGFLPFVRFIEKAIGRNQGELLDLGCGTGSFIRLMQSRGFTVAGAEIAGPVAAFGRERGLDVITAGAEQAVETYIQQKRSFDIVTMIHSFEHFPSPLAVLRRLRSIVKKGGLVAVNVPNVRYPMATVDRVLGTATAGIWDPIGHFNYFSLATLSKVFRQAGYAVDSSDSRLLVYGRTGILGAVDNIASVPCRWLGWGSNIAMVARRGD